MCAHERKAMPSPNDRLAQGKVVKRADSKPEASRGRSTKANQMDKRASKRTSATLMVLLRLFGGRCTHLLSRALETHCSLARETVCLIISVGFYMVSIRERASGDPMRSSAVERIGSLAASGIQFNVVFELWPLGRSLQKVSLSLSLWLSLQLTSLSQWLVEPAAPINTQRSRQLRLATLRAEPQRATTGKQ